MSKKKWDSLNKEEQEIITAAAAEAATFQRALSRGAQEVALNELKTKMEVSELPTAELAKVRAKLKPVIDKYSANVGAEFANSVFAEIEKVRGKK